MPDTDVHNVDRYIPLTSFAFSGLFYKVLLIIWSHAKNSNKHDKFIDVQKESMYFTINSLN